MHEYSPNSGKSNSPHSYEVTKIELLENQTAPEAQEAHSETRTDYLGTIKLLQGVEKSYDKGKKFLDESKDLTDDTRFRKEDSSEEGTPTQNERTDFDIKTTARAFNIRES